MPMRWGILLSVVLLAMSASAHAAKNDAPKVGPLDGKQVESLPPVITPMGSESITSERVANPALAEFAEKMEDYTTAVAEWQRLAHEFGGNDRANALFHLGKAELKLNQKTAAAFALNTFLEENPTSPRAPQARYYLLEATRDTPQQAATINLINSQNPRTEWDTAALYTLAYAEAKATGHVTETYGLEKAVTLQNRLKMLDVQNTSRKATAVTLALVPGGGQMFLGKYAEGGLTLTLWALLALAFLSACRHRHYAYAFVFVLPFAAIWVTSPGVAAQLAKEITEAERKASMPQWAALQPTLPVEDTPSTQTVPVDGTLNQLLAQPSPTMVEASPTATEIATPTTPVSGTNHE